MIIREPLPEDRILNDVGISFYKNMHRGGYIIIYCNNSVEIKCQGNHVVMTMDHFLETMKIVFDLNCIITSIMNTDEPDKTKLINHLNHESQWWEVDDTS